MDPPRTSSFFDLTQIEVFNESYKSSVAARS